MKSRHAASEERLCAKEPKLAPRSRLLRAPAGAHALAQPPPLLAHRSVEPTIGKLLELRAHAHHRRSWDIKDQRVQADAVRGAGDARFPPLRLHGARIRYGKAVAPQRKRAGLWRTRVAGHQ